MNTGNSTINKNLERAASAWRGSLFLRRTGVIGSALCLAFLLLALGLGTGWITEPSQATALVVCLLFLGGLFWLGSGVVLLGREADPRLLARAVERGQPQLMDRVNTLVALQPLRRQRKVGFYGRIAKQAQNLLARRPAVISLPAHRATAHILVFLALLALTVFVYQTYSPWQRMLEARQARLAARLPQAQVPPAESSLELAPPTNQLRQKLPWGEVRITDPSRDLQVTKVDVVPLQIEAAANEPLQQVGWASARNGQNEQSHDLPPPPDPRYAIYQPTLYLDELKLADWDVLSYYARASTGPSNAFASDVYFLEVRPFREDILKMPGGADGRAMQCLNELSSLISQQQHVVRQTHQHVQRPPETTKPREQDLKKLADAEADLSESAEHLYARLAGEMENRPIGDALDRLALAEKDLQAAAEALRQNSMADGQKQERAALADLVAARKAFHKAVSDHPGDFEEKRPEEGDPGGGPERKLKEIAEFRDTAKAAQEFMLKLLERQQQLANRTRLTNAATRSLYPKFAEEERQIQNSLDQFCQEHPQVFKNVRPEAEAASQSLQGATRSLDRKETAAAQQIQDATQKVRQLSEALKEKSAERSLADAYRLKQMLDRQIQKIGQCQNPGTGGAPTGTEVKQTVADTRQTLKQLKNVAEQPPTSEAFGPELRESLNQGSMMSMNWSLGELEQAPSPEARQKPAGEATQALQKVSQAFERSQPKSLQAAEKAGRSGEDPSFERGLAQLQSLVAQMRSQRQMAPEDRTKLGQEALYNLQNGLAEKGGSNERGNQLLLQLQKELQPGEQPPVDVEVLQSVLDALQAFSVELRARAESGVQSPQTTSLDPSRLPPAYRGRIQKYFEKLSEK